MTFAFARVRLSFLLGALIATPAMAFDLKEAYQTAIHYDAELLAAKAGQEETAAGVPVARAALLPQLNYSWQKNRAETVTSYLDSTRADTESGRYDSGSSSTTLRQALFRAPAWFSYQSAKAQASAAEATYQSEFQKAGMRAASSYLEVLNAREGLTVAQTQTKAMEAWLALAEKAFKAGHATRTDIEDARSRRDIAKARETEAKMAVVNAAHNFEVVTGLSADKIPDTDPLRLEAERMLVQGKEEWLQRIEANSPEIESLRNQLEAAQAGVKQLYSGHLPTIDLVAAHQKGKSETHSTLGTEYTTDYVGVQVNLPLVSGGGVMAQTRQSQAKVERIRQALESTRRKTLAEANRLYLTIYQGVEQVQALRQSVLSGEEAVKGEKKGIQAGTRTVVDALDAERRLSETIREHSTAIYTLANNRLKFLALAGVVDIESIEHVNAWLASAKR